MNTFKQLVSSAAHVMHAEGLDGTHHPITSAIIAGNAMTSGATACLRDLIVNGDVEQVVTIWTECQELGKEATVRTLVHRICKEEGLPKFSVKDGKVVDVKERKRKVADAEDADKAEKDEVLALCSKLLGEWNANGRKLGDVTKLVRVMTENSNA